jgi:predicted DNA-binding transcriptional regulator AlpA
MSLMRNTKAPNSTDAVPAKGRQMQTIPFSQLDDEVLIRGRQVETIIPYTPLQRSRLVKKGKFPPPIRIGMIDFWPVGEIRELIRKSRINAA